MNNEVANRKSDLIGSPIKECIKEQFIEEEEEEAKDTFPQPAFEKHRTYEQKHFD